MIRERDRLLSIIKKPTNYDVIDEKAEDVVTYDISPTSLLSHLAKKHSNDAKSVQDKNNSISKISSMNESKDNTGEGNSDYGASSQSRARSFQGKGFSIRDFDKKSLYEPSDDDFKFKNFMPSNMKQHWKSLLRSCPTAKDNYERLYAEKNRPKHPLLAAEVARNSDISCLVFSMHSQRVRPLREYEWVHGEIARIKDKSFANPPGSAEYYTTCDSFPATAWKPFIFPNPIRRLAHRGYLDESYTDADLADLERMIWKDPEPRFERPYRIYADSKYCIKGQKISDIGLLMRTGW